MKHISPIHYQGWPWGLLLLGICCALPISVSAVQAPPSVAVQVEIRAHTAFAISPTGRQCNTDWQKACLNWHRRPSAFCIGWRPTQGHSPPIMS